MESSFLLIIVQNIKSYKFGLVKLIKYYVSLTIQVV